MVFAILEGYEDRMFNKEMTIHANSLLTGYFKGLFGRDVLSAYLIRPESPNSYPLIKLDLLVASNVL